MVIVLSREQAEQAKQLAADLELPLNEVVERLLSEPLAAHLRGSREMVTVTAPNQLATTGS